MLKSKKLGKFHKKKVTNDKSFDHNILIKIEANKK